MTLPPAQPALNAAGKAFFGSLCAGTFVLGCWQTQRLVEKQQLMKERTKQLAMEPMPYNEKHPFKEDSFQRLVIRGQFLHEHECLVGPRGPPPGALPDAPGSSAQGMSSAPQGYMVLTPMKLIHTDETNGSRWWNLWGRRSSSTREEEKEDASSLQKFVLINRGWVPRNLVVDDDRRSRRGGRQPAQSSSTKSMLYTWERPTGVVQVQAIPSKTERKSQ
jgi:cytochrome oxidase assembly protein ShyY1